MLRMHIFPEEFRYFCLMQIRNVDISYGISILSASPAQPSPAPASPRHAQPAPASPASPSQPSQASQPELASQPGFARSAQQDAIRQHSGGLTLLCLPGQRRSHPAAQRDLASQPGFARSAQQILRSSGGQPASSCQSASPASTGSAIQPASPASPA